MTARWATVLTAPRRASARTKSSLGDIAIGEWNAFAFVYKETDGGNGALTIYVNGTKVGEIADIGFKLSEATDIAATVARNVGTNYLLTGQYDNIVVQAHRRERPQRCQ